MTSSDDLLCWGQGGISPSRMRRSLTLQGRMLSTYVQLRAKGPVRISSGVQTTLTRATAFRKLGELNRPGYANARFL